MLDLFFNKKPEPGLSITQCVKAQDEWCAEAHMETDYTTLTTRDFINTIENYIAFEFLYGEKGDFINTIKNYVMFKFLTGEEHEIN